MFQAVLMLTVYLSSGKPVSQATYRDGKGEPKQRWGLPRWNVGYKILYPSVQSYVLIRFMMKRLCPSLFKYFLGVVDQNRHILFEMILRNIFTHISEHSVQTTIWAKCRHHTRLLFGHFLAGSPIWYGYNHASQRLTVSLEVLIKIGEWRTSGIHKILGYLTLLSISVYIYIFSIDLSIMFPTFKLKITLPTEPTDSSEKNLQPKEVNWFVQDCTATY